MGALPGDGRHLGHPVPAHQGGGRGGRPRLPGVRPHGPGRAPAAADRRRPGALRPVLSHWRPLLVYSAVELCLPWLMLGYAEQHLSSSLAGLLVAAVPLVGAVLVKVTGHEQMGLRRVAGLLVGFAGVAALVGFDVETSSPWPVAAMGLVAFGYALGPLV